MTDIPDTEPPVVSRWTLLRDVGVFQIKLLVDGMRDLLLVPASLFAGIYSLMAGKSGKPGPQFYHLLEWGKESEHWINLFGALKNAPDQPASRSPFADRDMDHIVERFEDFVVNEYKNGGLTAQAKERLDKLLRNVRRKPDE